VLSVWTIDGRQRDFTLHGIKNWKHVWFAVLMTIQRLSANLSTRKRANARQETTAATSHRSVVELFD
jgi:hypothetical protein